jgi:hypothetical protein
MRRPSAVTSRPTADRLSNRVCEPSSRPAASVKPHADGRRAPRTWRDRWRRRVPPQSSPPGPADASRGQCRPRMRDRSITSRRRRTVATMRAAAAGSAAGRRARDARGRRAGGARSAGAGSTLVWTRRAARVVCAGRMSLPSRWPKDRGRSLVDRMAGRMSPQARPRTWAIWRLRAPPGGFFDPPSGQAGQTEKGELRPPPLGAARCGDTVGCLFRYSVATGGSCGDAGARWASGCGRCPTRTVPSSSGAGPTTCRPGKATPC